MLYGPFVVGLAVELVVLDVAGQVERLQTDAALDASLVPRTVHHSQQEPVLDRPSTSVAGLLRRHAHRLCPRCTRSASPPRSMRTHVDIGGTAQFRRCRAVRYTFISTQSSASQHHGAIFAAAGDTSKR